MKDKSILKDIILKILIRAVLIIFTVIFAFPFIWSIYSSLKSNREFYWSPLSLPQTLVWENYINAWNQAKMGKYLLNSVMVVGIALPVNLLISYTSAYAITRFDNFYTRLLKKAYVSVFMVPAIIAVMPLFLLMRSLHLNDNLVGLILVYIQYSGPFAVFVLTGFMVNLSREFEEAAFIDGCSRYSILFKIVLPLTKAPLITLAVLGFISYWNEFILSFTLITTDTKRTLPNGLYYLAEQQRYRTDWGAFFAGMVIVMMPSLIIYTLLQKQITSGITAGGLKM